MIFAQYFLAEVCLEIMADNEHYLAESGLKSVVDTVVHDGLALRTYAVELFETAIAAAHAGCKNV